MFDFLKPKPPRMTLDEYAIMNSGDIADFLDCVILDFETTGLSPEKDEIIEIGAVRLSGFEVIDTFQTFVYTKTIISPRVSQVNAITNDMIKVHLR